MRIVWKAESSKRPGKHARRKDSYKFVTSSVPAGDSCFQVGLSQLSDFVGCSKFCCAWEFSGNSPRCSCGSAQLLQHPRLSRAQHPPSSHHLPAHTWSLSVPWAHSLTPTDTRAKFPPTRDFCCTRLLRRAQKWKKGGASNDTQIYDHI